MVPTVIARRAATRRGMALPTALLVLLVLTLLGLAAVFTASTDLDIAGNGRQELRTLSFAEAGVHEALARLNMRDPSTPTDYRIVPAETAPGVPDGTWEIGIVPGTPGLGQVRTLTAAVSAANALPATTTIGYKIEQTGEQPVERCDADGCDGDVVRFHTSFGYDGVAVPNGNPASAPPVLVITSTYADTTGSKSLTIEAVRRLTQFSTPATVLACGGASVQGATTINGTGAPGNNAIATPTGTYTTGGGGFTVTGGTATYACPAPGVTPTLFEQVFGMTSAEMQQIADIRANAPFQPGNLDGKIIYITNDPPAQTTWQGNRTYGTSTSPVIVVFDGDFRIQGNVTIYGVVYVRGNFEIGAGTPRINGAIVSEKTTTVTTLTGNSTFAYNPASIDNLNRLSPFTTIMWRPN